MISHLFSCEHATCAVPEAYREIFKGSEEILTSDEGWEPGSLNLAQGFAMKFRTPLVHGDVTRLLIDLEQDGDARWSRYSAKLPEATRLKVIDRHERPFRTMLQQRIQTDLQRDQTVLHVAIHTHPDRDGKVRVETTGEDQEGVNLAVRWATEMRNKELDAAYGYTALPGATSLHLKSLFPQESYLQVRLSVSQSFFLDGKPLRWETAKKIILDALQQVTGGR